MIINLINAVVNLVALILRPLMPNVDFIFSWLEYAQVLLDFLSTVDYFFPINTLIVILNTITIFYMSKWAFKLLRFIIRLIPLSID